MHQSQNKETVSPWCDPHPFIRNCVITCANRVHANHFCTAGFDLADAHLNGIAVMIFCDAKEHKELRVVPIWLTKLPKRPAHGVNPSRRHIDAAKPAMGRIIRGSVILCPKTGKGLGLIASCEKGQFFGVFLSNRFQPAHSYIKRFVPCDFLKFARATGPDTFERSA